MIDSVLPCGEAASIRSTSRSSAVIVIAVPSKARRLLPVTHQPTVRYPHRPIARTRTRRPQPP
jgi:hypothetical protein